MAEHGSENYLDNLLNSVNGGEERSAAESDFPAAETQLDSLEQELFGKPESKKAVTVKNEEEFMREFEEELLGGEIPEYIKNYENEKKKAPEKSRESLSQTIDSMLDNMPQSAPKTELEQAVDNFDNQHGNEENAGDGEVDLSGMSDSDLMDMLSEDKDLQDLGDMLAIDEEGQPIEEGDPIGDFAEHEMDSREEERNPESAKGKEKMGFFAKLKRILFGDDDEDEDELELKSAKGTGAAELSAENDEILKELEGAGKKPKKEKKKKEKKPKPKKAKKPKKPKPKKPPKPKKEKPPAEPDNSPPLPKGPVVAIFVMCASLFGLIMLATHLLGYNANITQAKSLDASGDYIAAFQKLQGLDIKDSDAELYNRLQSLCAVYQKYDDYLVFDSYSQKEEALDSLVCAYGRYTKNKKYAGAYNFENEFEDLRSKIVAALLSEFDMTEDEALEVYNNSSRKEYTLALKTKLRELGMEE